MKPTEYLKNLLSYDLNDAGNSSYLRYFLPISELSEGLPAPILGIHLLIWQIRCFDLQKKYPLQTLDERLRFLAWCVVHGHHEYQALREASLFWEALNQKAAIGTDINELNDYGNAISWLMVLTVMEREDLQFNLSTTEGREQLCAWYMLNGRRESGHEWMTLAAWQTHYFFGPSVEPGLNRLQLLLYRGRPDVQAAFSLLDGKADFIAWFRNFISVESRLIDGLRISTQDSGGCVLAQKSSERKFGVNVIGHVFGQLGIGEDARMAAKSLLAAEVPVSLHNFLPGPEVDQSERSMEAYVQSDVHFAANIFCLTAAEHGRYFAENGVRNFSGRLNIGYWPWELPQWPEEWQHLFLLVDEVWVSSKHTLDAVAAVSPVPVRLMPMGVEKPEVSGLTRADLGLPLNKRLFLFIFDLNSSAKRKNPMACVRAFLEAFPQGEQENSSDDVALVIKIHPPKQFNQDWEDLKVLQGKDSRIILLEQTLSKEDLFAVYNECDCFLSLHRAEGFGRCIAEAMLLGKPVVVTAYSGNMSFNSQENSFLVPWMPKILSEGEYPYGDAFLWAEPNVSHAARQMRRIVDNPKGASLIGKRGCQTIIDMHSPQIVGRRYKEVLRKLLPND